MSLSVGILWQIQSVYSILPSFELFLINWIHKRIKLLKLKKTGKKVGIENFHFGEIKEPASAIHIV